MAKKASDYSSPAEAFLSPENETAQPDATGQEKPAESTVIPAGYRLVRETKSQRMQLLVTPRIKEGIEAAAKREGTSVNSLINIILMDYLEGANNG